ncbi:MAG: Hsp20/alpha crystallin family protein [Candidatus Brocadiales bacterium]|nr:Hsp20/alpha crystallin family protein [Candidatus Bathyanammoxibius sp.]MCQ4575305.1 Hsp20/alpha crystallin family protein [Candidatus Bathyanammoxibius amoris]
MAVPPSFKMDKIFQEFICIKNPFHSFDTETWRPPTDVYETEEAFIIKMAVAGAREKDISIVLEGNTLVISGKRLDPSEHKKLCFYVMEVRYGYFERSITLPKYVDEDKIEAHYKDGFLAITVPKSQEPRRTEKAVRIYL